MQVDVAAMDLPVRPALANIFIIPVLSNDILLWKRYLDNSIFDL